MISPDNKWVQSHEPPRISHLPIKFIFFGFIVNPASPCARRTLVFAMPMIATPFIYGHLEK
jgi:hypothetical protein